MRRWLLHLLLKLLMVPALLLRCCCCAPTVTLLYALLLPRCLITVKQASRGASAEAADGNTAVTLLHALLLPCMFIGLLQPKSYRHNRWSVGTSCRKRLRERGGQGEQENVT